MIAYERKLQQLTPGFSLRENIHLSHSTRQIVFQPFFVHLAAPTVEQC
jgi:hypothetical protein